MRILSEKEKEEFVENRGDLHLELADLQAALEDFSDNELVEHREVMLQRVNRCMRLILETDEDNLQ